MKNIIISRYCAATWLILVAAAAGQADEVSDYMDLNDDFWESLIRRDSLDMRPDYPVHPKTFTPMYLLRKLIFSRPYERPAADLPLKPKRNFYWFKSQEETKNDRVPKLVLRKNKKGRKICYLKLCAFGRPH